MPGPPWDSDLTDAFERIINVEDAQQFERNLSQHFYDDFHEAFFLHKNDEENDLEPWERHELRLALFDYLESLGYDRSEFDWQEWREWMGYDRAAD